jgi:gluconolactonase
MQQIKMSNASSTSAFAIFDDRFHKLLGAAPTLELMVENTRYPFAHEAGVFIPTTSELFITSNQFFNGSAQRCVQISKVTLGSGGKATSCEEIPSNEIPMANGGINYKDGILFCAQGSETLPSGLYHMSGSPPYTSKLLISDFYGRPFNSVNDVVVHSDDSIWFTDPVYGYHQGYRPKPELPNQVYRYDPKTKGIRAIADGFGRPNGICFSPDEKIVNVTDTDWIHKPGDTDGTRASTM